MCADQNKKYQGKNLAEKPNSLPYPASRLAPGIELVDLAQQISTADRFLQSTATARLRTIAEQIQRLQQDAQRILLETQQQQELHRAECNFKRQPGKTYHLYQKASGQRYFSMLAPDDWGGKPPHEFLASYRLENDMSWTALTEVSANTEADSALYQLLNNLPPVE